MLKIQRKTHKWLQLKYKLLCRLFQDAQWGGTWTKMGCTVEMPGKSCYCANTTKRSQYAKRHLDKLQNFDKSFGVMRPNFSFLVITINTTFGEEVHHAYCTAWRWISDVTTAVVKSAIKIQLTWTKCFKGVWATVVEGIQSTLTTAWMPHVIRKYKRTLCIH